MTQANTKQVPVSAPHGLGRRRLLAAIGVGMVLTLSGCGFQLRGQNNAPMAITQLDVIANNSDTHIALREAIERSDIKMTDSAALTLNLGKVQETSRQITFGDAGSIKRELTYSLVYSIQRKSDNAYLANQQTLEASSYFYTNDDNLLNGDSVRDRAGDENNSALATKLLERLRVITP